MRVARFLISVAAFALVAARGQRIGLTSDGDCTDDCGARIASAFENDQDTLEQADEDEEWTGDPNFHLTDYYVGGVNLASYDPEDEQVKPYAGDAEPFELFEEFDISSVIEGGEDWWAFREYKKLSSLTWPNLSFYYDKVASKRWLMEIGVPIPGLFALNYLSELPSSEDNHTEVTKALLELLPRDKDYCIKPNNGAVWRGVWLVTHNPVTNTNRTWSVMEKNNMGLEGLQMWDENQFGADDVARDVADALFMPLEKGIEGFPRRFIKPGVVVEERFVAFDNVLQPALEFKILIIWGKVFIGNWVRGKYLRPWAPGQVHRNGTMVKGSAEKKLPDWVDWNRVVELAERVGANKDFFRVDIFVGVPAGSPALRKNATEAERLAAVQYAASETQTNSGESPPEPILDEGIRLWTAGYKIGNYRIIKNTEIPSDYTPNLAGYDRSDYEHHDAADQDDEEDDEDYDDEEDDEDYDDEEDDEDYDDEEEEEEEEE